jgi:hypothetical protein
MISEAKSKDLWAMITRVARKAYFGHDVSLCAAAPVALNNEYLTAVNAAGTGVANLIKVNASNLPELAAGAVIPTPTIATAIGNKVVHAVTATVTLTQLKAGATFLANAAGLTLTPVAFRLKFTGTFTTATTIRLSDTNGTPVDIATVAIANATDGNVLTQSGGTGLTIGAGFGAALTAGKGLQLRDVTANTAAGGTSIDVTVFYTVAG